MPHPSTPCEAVRSIRVRLTRESGGRLGFAYALEGDLRRVLLPRPTAPRRADGLWRHTCFEAFVAPDPGVAYVELNFSPSGQWAAYAFDRYREGMTAVEGMAAPAITVTAAGATGPVERQPPNEPQNPWVLTAGARIDALDGGAAARVGLAAVIEETGGRLSYWALHHPPGQPDFHHPDGFVCRI